MKKGRQDRIAETLTVIYFVFPTSIHHKYLIYSCSAKV
jgi:hypothetical protein